MKLYPFPSRRSGRGYDDDNRDEEVAVTKVRKVPKKQPTTPGRRRPKSPADTDDEDERDRFSQKRSGSKTTKPKPRDSNSNLSFAGGSAAARSQTRGRSVSLSPARGRRQSLIHEKTAKRLSHDHELSDKEASSPESDVRRKNSRGASSNRSKASQSRTSTYSLSSSADESLNAEEIPVRMRSPAKRPSMSKNDSRNSKNKNKNHTRSPARRGRSQSRDMEDEDDGRPRGRVISGTSLRRSRSRGPDTSDDAPEPLARRNHHKQDFLRGKSRGLSGSRQYADRPVRNGRRDSSPPPQQKASDSKPLARAVRHSWGGFLFGRDTKHKDNKREEDDMVDIRDPSDEEEYDDDRKATESHRRRNSPEELREAPKPEVKGPAVNMIKKVRDEHYVNPKCRQPYANLFEYDNFPAIDRVPTAIGYHSEDSGEEFQDHRTTQRRPRRKDGHGETVTDENKEDDDNVSFTSRYSVDVKSVRGSKLKKNKKGSNSSTRYRNGAPDGLDDNFSHDENDDKYAQYLAGADPNDLLSDSSESCPPTWHPALDADDSDWYDEDEETNVKMAQQRNGNKKYQVSGVASVAERQKKRNKKKKKELTLKKTGNDEGTPRTSKEDQVATAEEKKGDAIVAARSNGSAPKSSRAIVVRDGEPPEKPLSDEEIDSEEDDEMTGAPGKYRRGKYQRRGGKHRNKEYDDDEEEEDEEELDDDSGVSYDSNGDTTRRSSSLKRSGRNDKETVGRSRKSRGGKLASFMRPSLGRGKQGNKVKSFKNKIKNFRRGGRKSTTGYGSSSDESSELRLAHTRSAISDPGDPSLAKLEQDEWNESTFTHNMMRNSRKEITELDEMDEASVNNDPGMLSCGFFPFGLAGLAATPCFYHTAESSRLDENPLDSVQIQRLRDSKYDSENKPKVEVILQDLQDPLAEKYDQLEKKHRKEQRQVHQRKEAAHEIEKREREELLRQKREMRETEQRKLHQIQAKDLALQEAPGVTRGQSFVMDISDWVLSLDGGGKTPGKSQSTPKDKDTPRTNGRDSPASPLAKLPFNTIEVPTASTIETAEKRSKISPAKSGKHQGWRGRKREAESRFSPSTAATIGPGVASKRRDGSNSNNQKKKTETKKRGWFRRG
jgi:hypothetical protein